MSLPPSLTSLYRLFLRTSSASVLHEGLATRNLRQLWRPIFTDAARVIKRLQTSQLPSERDHFGNWLRNWESRMDHTLSLLYVSANSRGLPHQLTRNLSQIIFAEYQRLTWRTYHVWNARLTPNAREYQLPEVTLRTLNKEEKARQSQYLEDHSLNALGLVVDMAEGRDKVCLGRVVVKGKLRLQN